MTSRVDWRERTSTVLSDMYDGDRHLIVEDALARFGGPACASGGLATRDDVTVPHPLPGVRYADGVATRQDTQRKAEVSG